MFSGEGFSAVCQWAIAEQGYRLGRRERETVRGFPEEFKQIEPVNLDSWRFNRPLADPKLFVSFAKLGASERPLESKCLQWVQKYGLLRRKDESQGWAIVRREDRPMTKRTARCSSSSTNLALALMSCHPKSERYSTSV